MSGVAALPPPGPSPVLLFQGLSMASVRAFLQAARAAVLSARSPAPLPQRWWKLSSVLPLPARALPLVHLPGSEEKAACQILQI